MTKAELVYLSVEKQKEFILENETFHKSIDNSEIKAQLESYHPDTIRGWALCLCSDADLLHHPSNVAELNKAILAKSKANAGTTAGVIRGFFHEPKPVA